jgi:hypothetical protein
MTENSAKVQAASNGGASASKPKPAQREHGMNRLREEECYHLTRLICDGLDEAEHLIRKVHNKAYNRTLDHDGSDGTKPLDCGELLPILDEAYECAALALTYIFSLSLPMRDSTLPPF